MRSSLFYIKAHLPFRFTPTKKSLLVLSSPFLFAALFCSPPRSSLFSPLRFPTARPFPAEQRKNMTTAMSTASSFQIPRDYVSPELRKPRYVVKKVLANQQQDGDGANVRRSIGRYFVWFVSNVFWAVICCELKWVFFLWPSQARAENLDPFLMCMSSQVTFAIFSSLLLLCCVVIISF
ncbi:hypothetical protein HPP92_020214 [Vanilla planifolia]|uniref:Transmembrane protein n=1 Tax=Vanilla planifolia TaxID=51239 RepID=A0A835Q4N3_VANPL|nr:hypothetical protein HPP92_020214 [Vanilla planifolia]